MGSGRARSANGMRGRVGVVFGIMIAHVLFSALIEMTDALPAEDP